jgi:hypothetical protein
MGVGTTGPRGFAEPTVLTSNNRAERATGIEPA